MDIPRLSPRVNPVADDLPEQPVTAPPDPVRPVLKQGESHDSSLSLPNAEEKSALLRSSAPVVRSQAAAAPEKSPVAPEESPSPPPEGQYNADRKFHYKDGNGERDYDIVAIIMELSSGLQTDVAAYPEMVRYECFKLSTSSKIMPGTCQILKKSITSDEYKIRVLASEVHEVPEPAAMALAKVHSLHLKDSRLISLAVLLAKIDGCGVARHFPRFGITDPEERFNVALACLKANPSEVPGLLRNYGLTSAQRLRLALAMAELAVEAVFENIGSYDLGDEPDRVAVAMACTEWRAEGVARHFKNFGITDQGQRQALARACALSDGSATAAHVKNFGLDDQEFLRELGLICAAQNGVAAASFTDFGCDDLGYKMRFAMLCAHSNGVATSHYLPRFRFPDNAPTRAFLWRLALACANQSGDMNGGIKNFGIADDARRYQLGLKCMKNGAYASVWAFDRIFPGLFPRSPLTPPANFAHYAKRVATLLLIADQNGGVRKDKDANAWSHLGAELAKLQQYPAFKLFKGKFHGVEKTSDPYPLLSPDKAGRLPHEAVCDAMNVFGGGGKLASLSSSQIAALAQIDSTNFANYFRVHANGDLAPQSKLDNPIARVKKVGIVLTPEALKAALSVVTQGNKDQVLLQARNKAFFQEIVSLLKNPKEPGKGEKEARKIAAALKANAKWTRDVLIQIDLHEFSAELVNALLPLLSAIHSLHDLRVRKDLTALIFEASPELLALWEKEAAKVKPRNAIPLFCVLPYVAQHPFLLEVLQSDARSKSPRLDNYRVSRPFIKAFRTLQESELAPEIKSGILKAIFPETKLNIDTIVGRMRKLDSLLGLSEERAEKLAQPHNTESLDVLLAAALEERLALKKALNVDGFQKTFGSYREPDTLVIYAGRIRGQMRAMEGLRELVEAVLEERFPAMRYEQDALLAACSPAFVDKWKTNRRLTFNDVNAGSKSSSAHTRLPQATSERYFSIVSDEILRDNHLPKARGGILDAYLRDKSKAAELLATPDGRTSSTSSTSSTSNTSSSSLGDPASHAFQRQCIAFLESPTLVALRALQTSLAALDPTSELKQALATMEADMAGDDRDYDPATLSLAFTDDHQQFMRMGSDMEGSCQRIDGDPKLNQGLIGSILDAKSRLCLIEDKNGVIVARTILRLMSIEGQSRNCLLMEPIYPALLPAELSTALTNWATQCATDLGLEMAALTKDDSLPDCTDTLVSGPIRYGLYSDAARGIQNRAFTVDSASARRQEKRLAWSHRNASAST